MSHALIYDVQRSRYRRRVAGEQVPLAGWRNAACLVGPRAPPSEADSSIILPALDSVLDSRYVARPRTMGNDDVAKGTRYGLEDEKKAMKNLMEEHQALKRQLAILENNSSQVANVQQFGSQAHEENKMLEAKIVSLETEQNELQAHNSAMRIQAQRLNEIIQRNECNQPTTREQSATFQPQMVQDVHCQRQQLQNEIRYPERTKEHQHVVPFPHRRYRSTAYEKKEELKQADVELRRCLSEKEELIVESSSMNQCLRQDLEKVNRQLHEAQEEYSLADAEAQRLKCMGDRLHVSEKEVQFLGAELDICRQELKCKNNEMNRPKEHLRSEATQLQNALQETTEAQATELARYQIEEGWSKRQAEHDLLSARKEAVFHADALLDALAKQQAEFARFKESCNCRNQKQLEDRSCDQKLRHREILEATILRLGSDKDMLELQTIFRIWFDLTTQQKMIEVASRKRVAAEKSDIVLDKALHLWCSEDDVLRLHAVLRSWRESFAQAKLIGNYGHSDQFRYARKVRHNEILDAAIVRWGSDNSLLKLQVILRAWIDITTRARLLAAAFQKRVAADKSETVLDKALLRWSSEGDLMRLHAALRFWREYLAQERLVSNRERFEKSRHDRKVRRNQMMESTFVRWNYDTDLLKLQMVLRAWLDLTTQNRLQGSASQKRVAVDKSERVLDKALFRWSSEDDLMSLHVTLRFWREHLTQAKLERFMQCVSRERRTVEVLDKAMLKWEVGDMTTHLYVVFNSWRDRRIRGEVAALRRQVARNSKFESVLDKTLWKWGSEAETFALQDILRCWTHCVGVERLQTRTTATSLKISATLNKTAVIWNSDRIAVELLIVLHAWFTWADQTRLNELQVRLAKNAKLDNTLDKALLRWGFQDRLEAIRDHMIFHAWRSLASQSKASVLLTHLKRAGRSDNVLTHAMMKWYADWDAVLLHEIIRAWDQINKDLTQTVGEVWNQITKDLPQTVDEAPCGWAGSADIVEPDYWDVAGAKFPESMVMELEILRARIAKNAKLDSTLDKALLKWSLQEETIRYHMIFHCWRVLVAQTKETIVMHLKRAGRLDNVLTHAMTRWCADWDAILLHEIIRAWDQITKDLVQTVSTVLNQITKDLSPIVGSAEQQDRVTSPTVLGSEDSFDRAESVEAPESDFREESVVSRPGAVLDKAILKWGAEADWITLHVVVRIWCTWMERARGAQAREASAKMEYALADQEVDVLKLTQELKLLRRSIAQKTARLDVVLDKAILKWDAESDWIKLHEVLLRWSGLAQRTNGARALEDLQKKDDTCRENVDITTAKQSRCCTMQ